jgi:hypothetical protein
MVVQLLLLAIPVGLVPLHGDGGGGGGQRPRRRGPLQRPGHRKMSRSRVREVRKQRRRAVGEVAVMGVEGVGGEASRRGGGGVTVGQAPREGRDGTQAPATQKPIECKVCVRKTQMTTFYHIYNRNLFPRISQQRDGGGNLFGQVLCRCVENY